MRVKLSAEERRRVRRLRASIAREEGKDPTVVMDILANAAARAANANGRKTVRPVFRPPATARVAPAARM